MSLFRRHKHNWEVKGRQSFDVLSKYVWETDWDDAGTETEIYYVCSECKDSRTRRVNGEVPLDYAKAVFPKP